MKCLKKFAIVLGIAATLVSCQRYPFLYYYVRVQDAAGHNLLSEQPVDGAICVKDLVFERHAPGKPVQTFKEGEVTVEGGQADAQFCQNSDESRTHLMIDASASIGVKKAECPLLVICFPDGTRDSLVIDNSRGTMSSPRYFINGVKQKDQDGMITIIR